MEGRTPLDSVLTLESGPNISTARNKIVRDFLDGQTAPWLLMCDTDMVLAADTLDRLIAAADPAERPVLGALCFSLDQGEKLCTMYELTEAEPGRAAFTRYSSWPGDAVMRVSATGAAGLLLPSATLAAAAKHAEAQ